jgi:hydroxymethylpyrimidine pyrophosphatase-like HAD family hydrolase
MDTRPKTIICDIDGTLIEHFPPNITARLDHKSKIIEGTTDKLLEWDKLGYYIILMTGRKESLRHVTEKQLQELGIFYDQLIMGIGSGARYIINDSKEDNNATCFSINLKRNEGIKNIKL